jgi:hypothetical protein
MGRRTDDSSGRHKEKAFMRLPAGDQYIGEACVRCAKWRSSLTTHLNRVAVVDR